MSKSILDIVVPLAKFHEKNYDFASSITGMGGDIGEAINNPSFDNIIKATGSLISSLGALATLTGTSNTPIDRVALAADLNILPLILIT